MKKQFENRKLLKIYIEQSQFDQLRAAASFECLSIGEFIRRQLTGLHETQFSSELEALRQRTDADSACPHHKRKGELCYKCDHRFGLPSIDAE